MSKLQKIEDQINKALDNAGSKSIQLAKKCTPKNIKKFSETNKEKFLNSKVNFKENFALKQKEILTSIIQKKEQAIEKIHSTKSKMQDFTQKAKSIDLKKINYKLVFISAFTIFTPFFLKLSKWVLTFKPATIATAITLSVLVSVTGVGIYKNSKKIIDETREPASVKKVEVKNTRPDYYKDNLKVFLIRNITLPVYLESVSKSKKRSLRKIVIDLTFLASNKYIKAYFMENFYLIHDRVNSNLEPISIDFPLEEEGKKIIKLKVKNLTNDLLKDLGIKGYIKQVYFNGEVGA